MCSEVKLELSNEITNQTEVRPPSRTANAEIESLADFGFTSKAYKFAVHLLKQKKYEEAEKVLRDLLRHENCFEVLEGLAVCLYHLGYWSECAHMARQALMLGEGFRDQRFQLLKFLGNSLIQIRDFEGA